MPTMTLRRIFHTLTGCLLLAILTGRAAEEEGKSPFLTDLKPFLTQYCADCHNDKKHKADVNFQSLSDTHRLIEQRALWLGVSDMLAEREMPPEDEPQPPEAERMRVLEFIETELARLDCTGEGNPGRVTLRRLNRSEYNNTIRDLLGVDFQPAADFPSDEVGYGFDNIGDVLSLPPLLMEKYLAAAEEIASKAIDLNYPPAPPNRHIFGEDLKRAGPDGAIRPEAGRSLGFWRESEGTTRLNIETGGRYAIRARAYGQQAGPELPKLGVKLNDKEIKVFEVEALQSRPRVYEFDLKLDPGQQNLAFAYLNNFNSDGDRNLFVQWIEVEGPLDTPIPPPPVAHARVMTCDPKHRHGRSCARVNLRQFAERAYRRPVTDNEVERLVRFITLVRAEGGSFNEGMQVAVQAVLSSPHFLFRWELDPEPDAPAGIQPLNGHQLASRLSYFLWSSLPDDELTGLARDGRLSDDTVLEAQVKRMLADPKAEALVENFAAQWLQIRNLDTVTPDAELFPSFTDSLRQDMATETKLFFRAVMKEDRSLFDLLDSDFTYVNEALARHYGITGVQGAQFRKVSLDPKLQRGGVLGHASVLTITSNPTRTSPVSRGKWVLEQILGTPPPPPPPNVPELEEVKAASASASLRERLELHRAKPECATCHNKMDPIGFAFENFNAIGAWRDRDGDFAIDPTGILPSGESFNGPNDLKNILKTRDTFVRSLAEKMLTFALGRGLEYYDKCAVDDIYTALTGNDYRFSTLVTSIVKSTPFRKKTVGSGPKTAPQTNR